jgi:hypothetical protein
MRRTVQHMMDTMRVRTAAIAGMMRAIGAVHLRTNNEWA